MTTALYATLGSFATTSAFWLMCSLVNRHPRGYRYYENASLYWSLYAYMAILGAMGGYFLANPS